MPQSTYISSTDPSGALLPDIQQLLYTNFDPSYIPIFGNTYLLKDFQSEVVSDYFRPYQGVVVLNGLLLLLLIIVIIYIAALLL